MGEGCGNFQHDDLVDDDYDWMEDEADDYEAMRLREYIEADDTSQKEWEPFSFNYFSSSSSSELGEVHVGTVADYSPFAICHQPQFITPRFLS